MTTPQPPQGGNPYGSPQGGNPYGQGGPQAPAPGPYGNQGGGFPPPPTPQRSGRRLGGKALRTIIGVVVAIAIAIGLYLYNNSNDTHQSAVGDCFENTGTSSSANMKKVDCTASNAEYKVAEKHDHSSDESLCDRNKYAAYTESGRGSDLVLCLTPLKEDN